MNVENVTHVRLMRLAGARPDQIAVDCMCDRVADYHNGGVAVYTNVDNGSLDRGHRQFIPFGTPLAPVIGHEPPELTETDLPPTLPNTTWNYQLTHIWRPEHG